MTSDRAIRDTRIFLSPSNVCRSLDGNPRYILSRHICDRPIRPLIVGPHRISHSPCHLPLAPCLSHYLSCCSHFFNLSKFVSLSIFRSSRKVYRPWSIIGCISLWIRRPLFVSRPTIFVCFSVNLDILLLGKRRARSGWKHAGAWRDRDTVDEDGRRSCIVPLVSRRSLSFPTGHCLSLFGLKISIVAGCVRCAVPYTLCPAPTATLASDSRILNKQKF